MKLTKAIETLTYPDNHIKGLYSTDFRDSIRLGVAALRRIQYHRHATQPKSRGLLPGETTD